eukprot:g13784.t1
MDQGEEDLAAMMLRNRTAFEKLPQMDVDSTNDEAATGSNTSRRPFSDSDNNKHDDKRQKIQKNEEGQDSPSVQPSPSGDSMPAGG